MGQAVDYRDLPPELFPVTIRAFRTDTDDEVWVRSFDAPSKGTRRALYVPALARIHGCPIRIRVEYGNGEVAEAGA